MSSFRNIRRKLMMQPEVSSNFFIAVTVNNSSGNNLCFSFDSAKTWTLFHYDGSDLCFRASDDLSTFVLSSWNRRTSYVSFDHLNTKQQLPINADYATISGNGLVIASAETDAKKFYRLDYPFTSYTQIYSVSQSLWTPPGINYDGSLIIGRAKSNKSLFAIHNGTTNLYDTSYSLTSPDVAEKHEQVGFGGEHYG